MSMNERRTRRSWVPVATVALVLASLPVLFSPLGARAATLPAGAPSAVRQLVASVTGNQANITWQAPDQGTVARYQVQAYLGNIYGSTYGTRITSATSISWDHLPLNQPVQFTVTPIGPDGAANASGPAGPVNDTGVVVGTNTYCPANSAADCLVANTTVSAGTETLPGAGVLHGTVPAGNRYASQLHLTHWRISAGNSTEYTKAAAYVPSTSIIEVLSDAWYGATATQVNGVSEAADPWANWSAYTNFITQTVKQAISHRQNPYWEIQNEPENYPYSTVSPPTRALVEQEYLYAYQAIKAANSSARIIGPSIDWQYENASAPWYIDMKTFIPFAAANGMKFAAIVWHENSDQVDGSTLPYVETPQVLRDQAQEVRELISENPGIGTPALFVDENSSASGDFSPGWSASFLAEEDNAGLAFADRSCWAYPGDPSSMSVNDCFSPNISQLLNKDSVPNASYWTMADYTQMAGTKGSTESTDPNVSSLVVTSSSGVTRILLGRHQTCSGWTAGLQYCPVTSPPPAVATTVNVLVPSGATSATVAVQGIPDTLTDMPTAPAVTTSSVPVSGSLATFSIPAFNDGEAYFVTVTPDSRAGSAPAGGDVAAGQNPSASGPSVITQVITEVSSFEWALQLQTLASPFTVLVTDQYGTPLSGQSITFSLPGGAGTFSTGQTTATVTSDAEGIAVSPPMTAGSAPGLYFPAAYSTSLGNGPLAPMGYFAFLVF